MEIVDYEKRRENRIDKYLDHLNPEIQRALTKKEAETFEIMQKAYHWRTKFFSPDQVRKMIMNEKDCSYPMACRIYQDMQDVFGRLAKENKEVMVRVLLEYYHNAYQLAIKSDADPLAKATLANSIADRIAKLYNVYDNSIQLTPEQLMPSNILINIGGTVNQQQIIMPPKYEPGNEEH